jgi:lipopolysaccharide transport system ATP-binding protein
VSAIKVEGVGKDYDGFKALDNVSFEVDPGTTVGVIGRNGAGKTTLLNLLAGITKPSTGRVELNGRVASIMEVGTGFHPDLSGRDNVFMNGQLMGMRKSQVKQKFDEIVDFSEIEEFIDVPVKNYSSGMYLRLAFSVFAHLSTDIILLDEVMGVGDASFRRKCEKKIAGLSKSGSTIVLVNHDVHSIMNVCSRTIYLKNGRVEADGDTKDVVNNYYEQSNVMSTEAPVLVMDRSTSPLSTENGDFKIHKIDVKPINENPADKEVYMSSEIQIDIEVEKLQDGYENNVILRLDGATGTVVLQDSMAFRANPGIGLIKTGKYTLTAKIPRNLLNYGMFYLTLFVAKEMQDPELFEHLVKIPVNRPLHEASSNWDIKNVMVRPHLEWVISPNK